MLSRAGRRRLFRRSNSYAIAGEAAAGYLFITPAMLFIAGFTLLPLVGVVLLALRNTTFYNFPGQFVGIKNFLNLFAGTSGWWSTLLNTFIIAAVNIPLGVALALLAAVLVNERLPARTFFRWGFLVPVSGSAVAVALMWLVFFDPSKGGIFNYVLLQLHVTQAPVTWLGNPSTALGSVILTMVGNFGFRMLIYLSALQTIPRELYEAAEIDGAGRWRSFFEITWRQVAPATYFIVINDLASSLSAGFQQVYVLTGGGPAGASRVVSLSIYQRAFVYNQLGYTNAMSFVVLFFTAIVTFTIGARFRAEAR